MARSNRISIMEREVITRGDDKLYLLRFILFKCPLFGVFIHQFHADDDACTHNHPWPFLTLIIRSGYWEYVGKSSDPEVQARGFHWRKPWRLYWRPASWAHRIICDKQKPKPMTIVFVGTKVQGWGFFDKLGQFIPWRQYEHAKHCE